MEGQDNQHDGKPEKENPDNGCEAAGSSDQNPSDNDAKTGPKNQERGPDRASPLRIAWSVVCRKVCSESTPQWLIAAFTFLLALFAYYAWDESARGTKAMEGQLQTMRSEQRPLVTVDSVSLLGNPEGINGKIAFKPFQYLLINSGKTPAYVKLASAVVIGRADAGKIKQDLCDRLKAFPIDTWVAIPNLKTIYRFPIPNEIDSEVFGDEMDDFLSGKGKHTPAIVGCIQYRSIGETALHFTKFDTRFYAVKKGVEPQEIERRGAERDEGGFSLPVPKDRTLKASAVGASGGAD